MVKVRNWIRGLDFFDWNIRRPTRSPTQEKPEMERRWTPSHKLFNGGFKLFDMEGTGEYPNGTNFWRSRNGRLALEISKIPIGVTNQ